MCCVMLAGLWLGLQQVEVSLGRSQHKRSCSLFPLLQLVGRRAKLG